MTDSHADHDDALSFGPLDARAVHLCIDMQKLFAEGGPWHTPWMKRVLPVVERLARHRPERTILTRFIPPHRAEELPGTWRRYYERWAEVTRERLSPPDMIELLPSLAALAPPAVVLDKPYYSAFSSPDLLPLLRERRVKALVISGGETDVCVLSTVLAAVDHGFRVVLATDALCSSSDKTHDALLTLYRERFGQQVETATVDTIIAGWR